MNDLYNTPELFEKQEEIHQDLEWAQKLYHAAVRDFIDLNRWLKRIEEQINQLKERL